MDWLQRTLPAVFPRLATERVEREREMALEESAAAYRQNMEATLPEDDDQRLISHHNSNVSAAYEEFCRTSSATDEDKYVDFEVRTQKEFLEILDSNWTMVEEFCRESLNEAKSKTLTVDCRPTDDGERQPDSQDYWDLMKGIKNEYVSKIGEPLKSKMIHIRLWDLDDRQDDDFNVCIDQWKRENQTLLSETTNSTEETAFVFVNPANPSEVDDDSNPLVTEDDSTSISTLNQVSPGISEEVFRKQLRLQMTWGRVLIFWTYWFKCRTETFTLLNEISEILKDEQSSGRSCLIVNEVLYQLQRLVMNSDDENLRCRVHDFPSFSVRFANVINKDIRCYRFLLQKLQGFVELVKCDDYLRTFQVEPSDIFLNISLLQHDVSVRNDRRSLGLENSERILEREGDSNEGTSWLLECKPAARPLVHLRELFDKLKQEGRLDPGGLAAVIDSLETEDREMEEMFAESIEKFLGVSSAVNDAFDKLRHGARQWLPKREETIARLKELAGQLDKTTRDVAITQAVGSSVGIVGGLVAIVGLALAPLTLGSSLIPAAIVGGVIGGVGALTAVGSTVAEIVIDKNLVDQVIGCLEEDRTLTDALVGQMSAFRESSSLLLRYIPQDELEYLISAATYDRSSANPDLAPKPGDIGPRLGITVSRLVAVGGKAIAMPVTKMLVAGTVAASKIAAMAVSHSIAAIGIGLDIANIVIAAKKLEKGAKYENAAQLERAIADLEKGKRVIADTYLDSEDSDLI